MAISNRQPSCWVEYDCNGKRKAKHFESAYEAKAFYQMKFRANKDPQIKKETHVMNAETKAKFVEACKNEWDYICYDVLEAAPNHEMKAAEVQEVLADYVEEPGWWKLSHDERAECLREAVPYDQSM